MSDKVTFYELPPSPNNMKIRIALNYKKIPFDAVPVDPGARDPVVAISVQPLTPVIKHGSAVVFGSSSILRFLDANFRTGPRLFAADRDGMYAIEGWELYAETDVSKPTISIAQVVLGRAQMKPDTGKKASAQLRDVTAKIEDHLGKNKWLVGDAMTAADIVTAPWIFYGMLPDAVVAKNPLGKVFKEQLVLGEGRDRTCEWVGRVMAYNK